MGPKRRDRKAGARESPFTDDSRAPAFLSLLFGLFAAEHQIHQTQILKRCNNVHAVCFHHI